MLDSTSVWMSSPFSYCWLVPIHVSSTWVLRLFDTLLPIFKSRVLGICITVRKQGEKELSYLGIVVDETNNSHAFQVDGFWKVVPTPPPPLPNRGNGRMRSLWLCELLSLDWLLCSEHTIWSIFRPYKTNLKSLFGICFWSNANHTLLK